jgi:GTPase SAR1 family protein
MADQWYRHGTGFLLVYSITDRPTFEALAGLHQNILRVKDREGGNVPCVVVSNKVSGFTSTQLLLPAHLCRVSMEVL